MSILKNALRGVGLAVIIVGLAMLLNVVLGWNFTNAVFNLLRGLHLILALALVGLYEAAMARRKGTITIAGRQLGLVGRIVLTLTLLIGIYLLLTHIVDGLGGYNQIIWVHGLIGLVAYGLTEVVLSNRRLASR